MKGSFTWKVTVILAVVALAILGLYTKPLRYGIDLRGGAELLFRIDATGEDIKPGGDLTQSTVDIVRKRIDPDAQKGIVIQSRDQQRIVMQLPGYSREGTKDVINLATNLGKLDFLVVSKVQDQAKITAIKGGKILPGYAWYPYSPRVLAAAGPQSTLPEGLLLDVDAQNEVTGELLAEAYRTMDGQTGSVVVGFEMKPEGAKRFGRMTRDHIGDQIAIVLNGEIETAPRVDSAITRSGIIKGTFTEKDVEDLVTVLNSGSLKRPLILESEQYVGPTVGSNTIQSALRAGIVAGIAVIGFMMAYYLFAGFVADLALCLNIIILLSFMAVSQATLTLPGIAGIVLTIGMAVDANVLIFERFREERRLGRDILTALRLGYEKAFSAIFDANLTTFATAAILYVYGTGPVKGFAVTLSVGIVISFFTAVFGTRVVLELLARRGVLKDLHMLHILTRTNVPFMKIAKAAIICSIVVIAAGVWFFGERGKKNLDIDFTGGSVANLQLTEPLSVDEVRDRVTKAGYSEATIQSMTGEKVVVSAVEDVQGTAGTSGLVKEATGFAIRVQLDGEGALGDFESRISETFKGLVHTRKVEVTVRNIAPVRAKNDPYFEGFRIECDLAEPLDAAEIVADIDAAGLPPHEVSFYQADAATGSVSATGDDAKSVSIFAVRVAKADEAEVISRIKSAFSVPNPFPDEISQVGPQVAKEMGSSALFAIVLSMGFIVIYIWFRFGRISYGVAAVVALVHDVLFTLGAIAVGDALGGTAIGQALMLGNIKINLPVVAALLTIVGYSLNDTIVVFDRIRENMRLKTKSDYEIIDGSINQTLSRTILTAFTTLIVLVVMYIMGGPGIHAFSYVMIVGIAVGTYSSIFIASPILLAKDIFKSKPIK